MSYILLIEDNQANADMVIRILSAEGYEIKHTLRGLEGAKLARQERPDLILLDFDLPDIDGRTMILTLKKQLGDKAAPPIVAVTARTADIEKVVAERFGCSAFVSKPFIPEEFVALVKRMATPTAKESRVSTQNGIDGIPEG
ncbi:MAG: response regulator transcription factor [Anaerolinea sp.]|nr:response regulator transcription factor [Anaerolinea sp.]MCC6974038.1 response regulator transcription factor [Anaerolineae bacterium]